MAIQKGESRHAEWVEIYEGNTRDSCNRGLLSASCCGYFQWWRNKARGVLWGTSCGATSIHNKIGQTSPNGHSNSTLAMLPTVKLVILINGVLVVSASSYRHAFGCASSALPA